MPTYYEVLGLPLALHNEPNLPAQLLRGAYRRALLQNHPDKSTAKSPLAAKSALFSIDQITQALSILSDVKARAKYDKELRLQNSTKDSSGEDHKEVFRTGIEAVDLDDLNFEEAQGIPVWYRGCRCGDDRGFLVREEDLEEAGDDGEICVGCRGCSLWLKVLFAVVEE